MFDKLGTLLKSYLENGGKQNSQYKITVPPELYNDFLRLGVAPGSPLEDCKSARKKLLKKHHPDKHAANPFSGNIAHNVAAGINASFQKIVHWYKTGKQE